MIDNECFEKIGFFLSAKGLSKMDTFSNTDPFAVVFVQDKKTGQQVQLGHTEVIMDTRNPSWPTQFMMNYYFESIQEVHIKIFDKDGSAPLDRLASHTLCGEAVFNVASLMCARGQKLIIDLKGRSTGQVIIQAEAIANTRDVFVGTFAATKLANKDGFFGKSDPFFKAFRLYESGDWGLAYQSPVIDNNLSPNWGKIGIPLVSLCNGDLDRPVKIEIWDHDGDGKHDFMGVFETSVNRLLGAGGAPIDVIEPDVKAKKKGYTNSGTFQVQNAMIEHHPTLSDFIMGGMEISLMVAIDFTASNGPSSDASSLHFISPSGASLNQYEQAIMAVGNVLQEYDSDKMYPVYGFGAKVRMPDNSVSPVQHCFPVYGGGLEVQGIPGVLQAYHDCLAHVSLSGPTLFSPLLGASTAIAAASHCSQEKQKYHVLLILTDGEINDMPETIEAIVHAADHPLSVIIVGVGAADFTSMNQLDGDGGVLVSRGKKCPRDVVQFVPFRNFTGPGAQQALAQAVLAEVPTQILQYMKMHNIRPNARTAAAVH